MEVVRELTVLNRVGIHLRAASKVVKLVSELNCQARILFNGRVADAKSIMSITQLLAPCGSILTLRVTGPDAALAADRLDELFRDKFGEE
jgi:phosphotransferase system HPr (HPr) family protein